MDNISYDETRGLNAHIDYKTRSNGGHYLQHLSVLPGCKGIYKTTPGNNGVIHLTDTSAHGIKIEATDTENNTSNLLFLPEKDDESCRIDNYR